ncbi:hypothetical protein NMY22_g17294 [Coprinellus aureogranulatus]|nr:hypothetical protein NMY22_g17294 [Coprinellus aureogranulatus]
MVLILRLANACIDVGHWPKHFKDSLSVVIPKPNKPAYSTPKAFRPIVLLNTLGKLLEKLISNRFQFDMIKYDLVDPNQMGGVRQRSTEDAGLFLTHLVRTGWVKGYHTSVVAFDIAQFFPSINHQFLLAVLRKQGFHLKVATFFASYLVQRFTRYGWNNFVSDPMQADVGLCRIKEVGLGTTLITFVDDSTIAAQTDSIEMNCHMLYHVYAFIHALFTATGLVLEHDKSEAFHFTRARSGADRPIDLGFAPHTGATPLRPKKFWRYLGFYFDQRLTFAEHVRYYSTKALTTVMAMRMLGNSTRGLSPKNKRILYRGQECWRSQGSVQHAA